MTVQYNPDKKIPHPAMWGVLYRSSTPFWEGTKNKQLLLQSCKECGTMLMPPRPMCPECLCNEQEWKPASGKGKIFSYVTYQKSPHPAFKAPYCVVLVELEEGVRVVSNTVDIPPDEIEIGMSVEVVFEEIDEKLTLFKFKKSGRN